MPVRPARPEQAPPSRRLRPAGPTVEPCADFSSNETSLTSNSTQARSPHPSPLSVECPNLLHSREFRFPTRDGETCSTRGDGRTLPWCDLIGTSEFDAHDHRHVRAFARSTAGRRCAVSKRATVDAARAGAYTVNGQSVLAAFRTEVEAAGSASACCRQHPPDLSGTRAGLRSRVFDSLARFVGTDPQQISQ